MVPDVSVLATWCLLCSNMDAGASRALNFLRSPSRYHLNYELIMNSHIKINVVDRAFCIIDILDMVEFENSRSVAE
jgi:hypothetical protein